MIGIVGAGITGLSLAYELGRHGVERVVFEADERPGGIIRSRRVEGKLLEWGPQRGRMVDDLAGYVKELRLEEEVILAPEGLPLYVYAAGKLRQVPFSVRDFVSGDLLSWGARIRMAFEIFTAGPDPEETVEAFFVRKVGRQPYERLAGPLYGGLYASDPADMIVGLSLNHVLRRFGVKRSLLLPLLSRGGRIDAPAACSFTDGMQMITDALYNANAEHVRLSTPVRSVRSGSTGRWTIETDGATIEVEKVVVTCPAAPASKLLSEAAPETARAIGTLNYNPLAVVHLHAETDLEGLGYQVSLAEDLATRGVTWNDSMFDRDGVYTAYLGGAKSSHVVEEPDDRLGDMATREFEAVTGHEARVLSVAREEMAAWDRSWRAIREIEMPEGIFIAAGWKQRPGIPGRLAEAKRLARALADAPGGTSGGLPPA